MKKLLNSLFIALLLLNATFCKSQALQGKYLVTVECDVGTGAGALGGALGGGAVGAIIGAVAKNN